MPKQGRSLRKPWKTHTKKILLAATFVVIPMISFTIAVLAIVFSNIIDLNHCPEPELCPYANAATTNGSDYYVDFPVGRLAFVSSLSSTISLALVAAIMTMYGSIVARQMVHASAMTSTHTDLLSPYATSTIIRLLNAEVSLLYEMVLQGWQRLSKLTKGTPHQKSSVEARVLWLCRTVFLMCLFTSVFVQIADTYFHIVIDALSIERLKIEPEKSNAYQHSRRLAPWFFKRSNAHEGTAPYRSVFYSASLLTTGAADMSIANRTTFLDATNSLDSYVLNFTDPSGISYAVVRPSTVDPDLDWTGTGYGVSTQCAAVPRSNCQTIKAALNGSSLHCTTEAPGRNVTVRLSDQMHKTWTTDWHEHMEESEPFSQHAYDMPKSLMFKDNLTSNGVFENMAMQESDYMFRNPWHWMAKIDVWGEFSELPKSFRESPLTLERNDTSMNANFLAVLFILSCKTTVFDTTHTVIDDKITSLTASPSNGSVAGMVSMMSLRTLGFMAIGFNSVLLEVNHNYTTPEDLIATYALSMSKRMSVPLVVHTIPAPADLVQRRFAAVVTRLPKAALWLLVVANLAFVILGTILAVLAIRAASPEVHQVQIRLSTAGLAAQLFDSKRARYKAKDDSDLFGEKSQDSRPVNGTRVGVRCTSAGGAEFVKHDAIDKKMSSDEDNALRLRQTHTL